MTYLKNTDVQECFSMLKVRPVEKKTNNVGCDRHIQYKWGGQTQQTNVIQQ